MMSRAASLTLLRLKIDEVISAAKCEKLLAEGFKCFRFM
jgi:hypothetical protein